MPDSKAATGLRYFGALLLAAGLYYLLARLGLKLALDQSNASPIWPPSGFALVLLLRYGLRYWLAILPAAFMANLVVFQGNHVGPVGTVLAASLAIACGNALEAIAANLLVRRYASPTLELRTQRMVYLFVLAIAGAAAVSAAVGTSTLRLAGIIPAAITTQVAATWWVGDFLGMLLLAPMGMALPDRPHWPRLSRDRLVFAVALLLSTLGVFLTDSRITNTNLLPYGLLLFLGLAAVRRQRGMIRLSLAVIAAIAIPATVLDHGPFVSGVLHHSLLSLCTFLAIISIIAWILSTDEEQKAERYPWTPLLTLAACMALTAGAWAWITNDTESRTRERFLRTADDVRATLKVRMESYESMLRAGAALYDASRQVERDEWRRFVAGLDMPNQYPGVLGLGYARMLNASELQRGLAEIREDTHGDFRLWPDGKREWYSPIVHLEPRTDRNQHALGFDLMSEQLRRDGLMRAMRSGRMTVTEPLTLVQEIRGARQVGFLMFNPVYGAADGGGRRLIGFVYSPFRMGDLMAGIFSSGLGEVKLDISFDNDRNPGMYSSEHPGQARSYLRLESIQHIPIANDGQQWRLRVTPTAQFDASIDQGKSFLVLVMGTAISLLFFGISRNLVQARLAAQRATARSAERLKQQTASLEESEARFKLLTAAISNHAIILLDADGTISTWNGGAERLFGYQAAEIVGEPVTRLHAGQRGEENLRLALLNGQYEETAMRRRKDGTLFLALAQIFPVRDESGVCIGFAKILRDVTAEKAAEKELQDAKTQAESASAAKSAFVANISHELRTPMNAVLGLTQILQRTQLNAEQRQYLDMVSGAGKSLLALLNDVLDFSKIEANKLELSDDDYLLDDVIDAVASVLAIGTIDKALALSLCIDAGLPASLHGDAQRVQQVLLNLASNAMKFTERGTVSVHVHADQARPGWIRFDVVDTGIGITSKQLERLFSPFSQADASMSRKYGGTGLGLAISQRLAGLMGGSIEVHSEHGIGTTFSLVLPLRPGRLPDRCAMPASRAGWRVLYADANLNLHRDIVQMCARWNWHCDTVSTPQAFRQALASDQYDLLLFDGALAAVGGLDHARGLRVCLHNGLQARADGAISHSEIELRRPLTRSALFDAIDQHVGTQQDIPHPVTSETPLAGVKVLLAEDNALNQLVAQTMLEGVGATVNIVNNGQEALDYLRSHADDIDVVLMDVQMPVMDGFTATKLVRSQLHLRLPVLAMSAGVTMAERAECEAAGMDDFVAKPVDGDELVAAILRHLQQPCAK